MSTEKFSELCEGTAVMLTTLAHQAKSKAAAGELQFSPPHVAETIVPLAQIIAAIAESAS